MTWKQRRIAIEENYERIREGVVLLRLQACDTTGIALLTRTTPDRRHRVLLLTPQAVERAGDALSTQWVDCDAPELFAWDLVVGEPDTCSRFGLPRPQFGKPPPSPIANIGRDPHAPPQ